MPAPHKQKPPKGGTTPRTEKAKPLAPTEAGGGVGDLAVEVKRLAREVEAMKEALSKRPAAGGDGGASRRDQDKILADRIARLDERVDSLWARVSDLEETLEGEGGRTRDADLDEAPDRDFFEH